MDERRQGSLLLGGGLLSVLVLHLLWASFNDAPPIWDMAYHEATGWRFLEAWREGRLWDGLAALSGPYPPWFYLQEMPWIAAAGGSPLLGVFSNLGAMLLLALGTWRLGRALLPEREAVAAAVVVLLFPAVAWMSRETVLDVWLAAWVALAGWCLLESRFFDRPGWTLGFGLAVAGGVMTKWTCPLYLLVPSAWWWWQSRRRWKALANLALAAAVSLPLVLPYYLPNLFQLASRYPTTEQAGLIPCKPYPRHGEPGLDNLWGWIYYPRVLAGYFLQLPLLGLLVAGLLRRRREEQRPLEPSSRLLPWVWLAGGVVVLTFLTPKDPRFALPLAPPLAILLLRAWRGSRAGVAAVLGTAGLAFLLASFPTPLGEFRLALGKQVPDPDFQGLQREWALLQTNYFGVAGPPRREDWRYRELLDSIPEGASVGFLPDLPRFHAEGLQLEAVRRGRSIRVRRAGWIPPPAPELRRFDFLVAKTGAQGISFTTEWSGEIARVLPRAGWSVVGSWPLPDGSEGRLVARPSP